MEAGGKRRREGEEEAAFLNLAYLVFFNLSEFFTLVFCTWGIDRRMDREKRGWMSLNFEILHQPASLVVWKLES